MAPRSFPLLTPDDLYNLDYPNVRSGISDIDHYAPSRTGKRVAINDVKLATSAENAPAASQEYYYRTSSESDHGRRPPFVARHPKLADISELDGEEMDDMWSNSKRSASDSDSAFACSTRPSTTSTASKIDVDQKPDVGSFSVNADKRPRNSTQDRREPVPTKRRRLDDIDPEVQSTRRAIPRNSKANHRKPAHTRTQAVPGQLRFLEMSQHLPPTFIVEENPARPGSMSIVTLDIEAMNLHNEPMQTLYVDVQGVPPPLHPPLDEIDTYNIPLTPQQFQAEADRAIALSKKSIPNAPPFTTNLPLEEMLDITQEELIIYFPNHVLRWPGMALALRCSGWDQLFHRVARLINVSRGSSGYERDYRHAEPAPCMIKIQATLQEIEPRYSLAEHDEVWAPQLSFDLVKSFAGQLPKRFPQEGARTVTLTEAGEYVGCHGFQDRPFSKKVRAAVAAKQASNGIFARPRGPPQMHRERTPRSQSQILAEQMFERMFTFVGSPSALEKGNSWTPSSDLSHLAHDEEDQTLQQSAERNGPSLTFASPAAGYETDAGAVADAEDGSSTGKLQMLCRFGVKCFKKKHGKCRYRHEPRQEQSPQLNYGAAARASDQRKQSQTQILRATRNCEFGRHSPTGDAEVGTRSEEDCKYGVKCTNAKCNRRHPSPASFNGAKGSQNGNQQAHGRRHGHKQKRQRPGGGG